jgi:hypothetical protein
MIYLRQLRDRAPGLSRPPRAAAPCTCRARHRHDFRVVG